MPRRRFIELAGALAAFAACAPRQVAPPQPHLDLVIEDVSVIDVRQGVTRTHLDVGVSGSRIVYMRSARGTIAQPDARHIDGRGRFLIPGLWDMHTHSLWGPESVRTFLPTYVANGVTGIRDMGGKLDIVLAVRDSIRRGNALVPRVIAAGPMLDGPKPIDPDISVAVGDASRGREVVDSLVRAGVDFIKVYTLLPRDAYFAIAAEATRLKVPFVGHVPASITPAEAAIAGQHSIEHLREEIEPFCTPADPSPCAELYPIFREHHTWQVPTLVVLRQKGFKNDSSFVVDPRLAYIPTALRDSWMRERQQTLQRGPQYFIAKRERFRGILWLTAQLWREHVPILAGTDAGVSFCYPGFSLHDELALLVEAGMSAPAALRAATLGPAEFLAATDSMGTVDVGHVADLVLLRANPLSDIRATREIEAVVLRGRYLNRNELDSLLAKARVAAR